MRKSWEWTQDEVQWSRHIILVLVASKMHLLPRVFVSYVSWGLELKKTLKTYLKNRINSPQLKQFRNSHSTIKSF